MRCFVDILKRLEVFGTLCRAVSDKQLPCHVVGTSESQKAHLISSVAAEAGRSFVVVTSGEQNAMRLRDDLSFFCGQEILYVPAKDLVFYHVEAMGAERTHRKIEALAKLENAYGAVISIEALLQPVTPKQHFTGSLLTLEVGAEHDPQALIKHLVECGYTRVDFVEGVGQVSLRGGIMDIYSPGADDAVRIEFFDTEIDSIRLFDPLTQLSTEKVKTATILPATELSETGSLTEYIGKDRLIFFDEPQRLHERHDAMVWEMEETVKNLLEKGAIEQPKARYFHPLDEAVKALLPQGIIGLSALSRQTPDFKPKQFFDIQTKILQSYGGKIEFLIDDLRYWREKKYCVIILAGSKSRGESVIQLLEDKGVEAAYYDELNSLPPQGTVAVTHGSLSKGFEYPLINTVLVSDREIFPGEKKKRRYKNTDAADKIKDFSELHPGDYVVHTVHGIGRYVGLESMTIDKIKKDYLKICYKGEDFLYVPVSQLDMLNKYRSGSEEANQKTKLSKLGGTEWKNTKAKVKKSVEDLARKLVELYASRSKQQGFAFSPDTPWQRQFEDEFIYEETPDQLRSIEEIKKDMESPRPMDRLLCGDVGFGKTEVAIRAAFKAVMDGKQVAYLVPTTVLAAQHLTTFVQRMMHFPIKVEMLSRFRSPAEQKNILRMLKSGEVDVVIGTHRLLQADVQFKDLGLLIIDEEQRFGVAHKERIKELKTNVDVLSLSATPIPRSLHMSMIGIRDMSLLTQPPEDRYPIQTYVMEYNEAVIADALAKEIERGGQVFYLYNRVQGIHAVAERIRKMVPGARVEVAHGQMREQQLEEIMLNMVEGEIDVLVCTTIIETGLDIANANTMIIEHADCMGLAQLYQLRGRVGRSNRLAYAYLTYRRDKALNEISEKRLRAIREFTEFGSGFKIALRDLELRGAGNVLGPEQHGFMATVGYDVYCEILQQAVCELKGETFVPKRQVNIDLRMNAYIPESYIQNQNLRIEMYKKIAAIEDLQDRYRVEEELEDRFGDPPKAVSCLVAIAFLKTVAEKAGVTEISENEQNMIVYLDPAAMPAMLERIGELISASRGKLLLNAGQKPYLAYRKKEKKPEEIINNLKNLLEGLKKPE